MQLPYDWQAINYSQDIGNGNTKVRANERIDREQLMLTFISD